MKKFYLVSMSIFVSLAFTVAGEEGISSRTLFNSKWKLEGFFNAVTNQLEKPDSIGEDWYTFEFAPDSVVMYEDMEYRICRGNASGDRSRRQVSSWDLRDAKGRPVSAGTYLVKGTVKTSDGKREKVSIVLGVR